MSRLHYDRVTAPGARPTRLLLVLHGIYGAGRNWSSVARRFVEAEPAWGAALVDLREHGRSTGFEPPHTLEAAAADVERLVDDKQLHARAILGHSFGGKVALLWAERAAEPPAQLWVIDSTPAARAPSGSAWDMLGVLRRAPGPFNDRGAAVAAVEAEGFATPVAQWMSTNVERGDDGNYRWRLDADVMEALLSDFFATDAWSVLERPPGDTHIHVVKATDSSVLDEEAVGRIRAAQEDHGRVTLHEIEGGHWLNADNPDALEALLVKHLG